MSEIAKFLAQIGGAISAQSTGGPQGLQNFMNVLAQQQAQKSKQDFASAQRSRDQMFTLYRDRKAREHQNKRDAAQRKHEKEQLQARHKVGVEADNTLAVNYLAQAGVHAQSQGGDALAQWQGFSDSLVAGGYLPSGPPLDYSTPEGLELLKSALAGYVGNVGSNFARRNFGQTKEVVGARQEAHWNMFGTAAPQGYSSEEKIRDANNYAIALSNVGKATDEATRIRRAIDALKVTEQDTAESVYARLLPVAEDYGRLTETLQNMEGVYGPNDAGQLIRQGDTAYTPFLSGAAPLGKDYNALRARVADLRSIFDAKRETLKTQVYAQRSIGQTGELMVNTPGWGGGQDSEGNPTETEERVAYFSGPIYQRENAQYREGVDALVNLSEAEARAQGVYTLWQQFQAAVSKEGEPLYNDLAYWANIQFGGTSQAQADATEVIKEVFKLNPARIRARADIHRGNKADLEEAAVGINALNLDIGYTVIKPGEVETLRNNYGREVTVDDGLGGEEVVRRIGDLTETLARWAADPDGNAIERLSIAALETTPAQTTQDYGEDGLDLMLDRELLDHRIDMMADRLGLDTTRTTRIKEKAWDLYNSGRDFTLSDNPLAADVPTAATPRLNSYKAVLDAPVGQAGESSLSDLLTPTEQQEQLDAEYAWLSDSYSTDRGPELIANLRAAASKGKAAATQATASRFNLLGPADSESIELGIQTSGNTDFSLLELLDTYNANGASKLFKTFLTTPGNAAGRRTPQIDRAYQRTPRLSFAVQYKEQQDRAGIQVDNQIHNRLALLDAMRGQRDPGGKVSSEQRATLLMVRDTLRSLSYDEALAFYGDSGSTGMPFNLIEEGQDVLDPVERKRIEEYLDLSTEAQALTRNQEELARAATTINRNRFAVYDENGEDIFKPYDEALFNSLSAQNEGDLADIEEINAVWGSENVRADIDPILVELFGDITASTPMLMASKFDPDSEDGRTLIAALTGVPVDQIEDMFKTSPFRMAVNQMRDAQSWDAGMKPLLVTLQKTAQQRIEARRARTGMDSRGKSDNVVRMRINEYGEQRQRVATNLQRLQQAKGRPLETTDFNPEVADYLRQKGFSSALDFEAQVNLVFAASLYTY